MAWIVLLIAFASFCVLATAIPLGVRYYLTHAEDEVVATVESLAGTIVIEPPVGAGPLPLGKGQSATVTEGSLIRVDETSEAFVTFLDHTMHLAKGSTIRFDRLRAPRFDSSSIPDSVHISIMGGQVDIGTALSLRAPLDFLATMLQARAALAADGSYALNVTNERCEVMVYRGNARIDGSGAQVVLHPGERTQVYLNRTPEPPTGVARELVTNGDFRQPLSEGWRVFSDQGTDGGNVDGQAETVVDEGRYAARLWRTGGQGNHCETILEQRIERELPSPVTSLVVRATVKVREQTLSGGGYLGSEYPLMIRMTYRDVYDSETEWVIGFYVQNADNHPTAQGLEIPQDRWYTYESGNLLEELSIRPYKIVSLRVYASGWDYESLVSGVQLIER
jgi:hypothetical protein